MGRGGEVVGAGESLTAVRPGRPLPDSHHGPGEKGEKGQGASGEEVGLPPGAACSEPSRTEGRHQHCPPSPRARPSSPASLFGVGGGVTGRGGIQGRYVGGPSADSWTWVGGRRRNTLGWPLAAWVSVEVGYWLRGPQPGWLLGVRGREDVLRGHHAFPHPRPSGAGASEYGRPRSSGSSPRNSQHFPELCRRPTTTSHLFAPEGRPFPHPFNSLIC